MVGNKSGVSKLHNFNVSHDWLDLVCIFFGHIGEKAFIVTTFL